MRTADIKLLALGAVVLIASCAFYSFYFFNGVNFIADDGNYAQIAYELYLGREMDQLVIHYGVLWFKIGEVLFHLFGPDFTWVRLIFIGSLIATVLLVFLSISLATENYWLAAILALAPIPATASAIPAIYGICIMLNVAAQMRLAYRMSNVSGWDAAIAGAALSITFQLRPDFGYVFLFPLIILLSFVLRAAPWHVGRARIVGACAIGFGIAHVPIAVDAIVNGYMHILIQQYLEYPALMAEYFLGGIVGSVGTMVDSAAQDAGTLLQRPALTGIFSSTGREAQMAWLTYGPVFGIGLYIAINLLTLKKRFETRQWESLSQSLAVLGAAAAFPHYFFFRPDLQHIANFMLGYVVLVGVLVSYLWVQTKTGPTRWRRVGSAAVLALLATQVVHLTLVGFNSPGDGAISIARDRPEIFSTPSVARLNVTIVNKDVLDFLHGVIQENSDKKEKIVCVPYCPGVAFMSERQLFFENFYVDDSLLVRQPNWIPDAITRTIRQRPPVVIVMDVALNGTEISRFKNWAAPYMEALQDLAREKIERPGLTIYLL